MAGAILFLLENYVFQINAPYPVTEEDCKDRKLVMSAEARFSLIINYSKELYG
jgi:hypothetical protein